LGATFRGRDKGSVRRGRPWHEITVREPHHAVNTAETVPFEKTAAPVYAPKLAGRSGGSAPLITTSMSKTRPASRSSMLFLKSSGTQESSVSTTNLVTSARSSGEATVSAKTGSGSCGQFLILGLRHGGRRNNRKSAAGIPAKSRMQKFSSNPLDTTLRAQTPTPPIKSTKT